MVQKNIVCGACGMSKCMNKSPGGCLIKGAAQYLVFNLDWNLEKCIIYNYNLIAFIE